MQILFCRPVQFSPVESGITAGTLSVTKTGLNRAGLRKIIRLLLLALCGGKQLAPRVGEFMSCPHVCVHALPHTLLHHTVATQSCSVVNRIFQ